MLVLVIAISLIAAATSYAQANIVIQNADSAGVGFNDTTPASPVGGNSGTTIGQQRLIVFQTAVSIWGAALKSSQTITIKGNFSALPCSSTSGSLGAAYADTIWWGFSGGAQNRLYSVALAEALSNRNLNGTSPEIDVTFNSSIGTSGCLDSDGQTSWYYGLDNNHRTNGIDLLIVLLHEIGHGLGFVSYTDESTGAFTNGIPSIWDDFLLDDSLGLAWSSPQMSDAQRAASATRYGNLLWSGPQVNADVPAAVLSAVPRLRITAPSQIAANYQIGTATFGPLLAAGIIPAQVVQSIPNDGCSIISNSLTGKIALIDRGTCSFVTKTKNAQNAGAVGVIIVDDSGSSTPPSMSGSDSTITIPTVSVTTADGNTIKNQLGAGVNASLLSDIRPFMYTPTTVAPGSSISHWDTALTPNQLMEPSLSDDLSHSVRTPQDLTLSLLRDIGWPINPNPPRVILIEQGTANTASTVDSVTFERGPFTVLTTHDFASDGHRRLIMYVTPALSSNPVPTVSVTANGIPLTVEAFGTFNALAGTSYIVVALPSLTPGDYSLVVTINGVGSANSPTITIQ